MRYLLLLAAVMFSAQSLCAQEQQDSIADEETIVIRDDDDAWIEGKDKEKAKIDFTHVIKIRPTVAPAQSDLHWVQGEYAGAVLSLQYAGLGNRYTVKIEESSGQVFMQRQLDNTTEDTLNISLKGLSAGHYTIVIENEYEAFVARFAAVIITDISDTFISKRLPYETYDLNGRYTPHARKGIYIRNGRKTLVQP